MNDMPKYIWAYETGFDKGRGTWYDQDVSGELSESKCTCYQRIDSPDEIAEVGRAWLRSLSVKEAHHEYMRRAVNAIHEYVEGETK